MPLDAVLVTAVAEEISKVCLGARIDKVQQPEKDKIILSIRGRQGNRKILLCARAGSARVHFTTGSYENPPSPPMFCMLLRKHLSGAKIMEIKQPPMERILEFSVMGYDELGAESSKRLIVELMGRYSNIILTDNDGIIIDSLRRVDEEMSRTRRILPGLRYQLPPQQGKMNPITTEFETIESSFSKSNNENKINKWLLDSFFGLSPLVCREITEKGAGDTDTRILELSEKSKKEFLKNLNIFLENVRSKKFTPVMVIEDGSPYDYSYLSITQYGSKMQNREFETFSELLDSFYAMRDREERLKSMSGALIRTLTTTRDRISRKIARQKAELMSDEDRERKREIGDIITANLYNMKKGDNVLIAPDFYSSDGGEIKIKLDPLKSPQQNAAKYYRDYTKSKKAVKYLTEQIEKGENEVEYLESVLDAISRADGSADIAEIKSELSQTGFLKQNIGKKKMKEQPSRPRRFLSSDGVEIIVGRNNLQNDKLTFKTALRHDIWLHAQKIHGSHVIVRNGGAPVSDATLEEAAIITASHSQCDAGAKVPVDYTEIKNVKRQPGGKPGMVFYTEYKTAYVAPDLELCEKLSVK